MQVIIYSGLLRENRDTHKTRTTQISSLHRDEVFFLVQTNTQLLKNKGVVTKTIDLTNFHVEKNKHWKEEMRNNLWKEEHEEQ